MLLLFVRIVYTVDPNFKGRVICGFVPSLFFAPEGSPPVANARRVVRYTHKETLTEWMNQQLFMMLERHLALLENSDLALGQLLKKIPVANRSGVKLPPLLPPYMSAQDVERRARLIPDAVAATSLRERIRTGWIPLFTPPPPPADLPKEKFFAMMEQGIAKRIADVKSFADKIAERGGSVVFLRCPSTGPIREIENKFTPRPGFWDRLLRETGRAGIHFEDHAELSSFDCPEWSHLSYEDSLKFTTAVIPHLTPLLK